MKVKGHVLIILCIVFLLSMTNLSSAQTDESSQDELPRILVYECYNYRILEIGTLDPRMMTDDELRPFSFRHSKDFGGYYFEYEFKEENTGNETKMRNTRVFVLYSLGDQITVLSRHTFKDSEEITADVVLS